MKVKRFFALLAIVASFSFIPLNSAEASDPCNPNNCYGPVAILPGGNCLVWECLPNAAWILCDDGTEDCYVFPID